MSHDSIRGCVRPSVHPSVGPSRVFFCSPKMREIELGAAKGVSERQGGQRLDGERLISCIRTCLFVKAITDTLHISFLEKSMLIHLKQVRIHEISRSPSNLCPPYRSDTPLAAPSSISSIFGEPKKNA